MTIKSYRVFVGDSMFNYPPEKSFILIIRIIHKPVSIGVSMLHNVEFIQLPQLPQLPDVSGDMSGPLEKLQTVGAFTKSRKWKQYSFQILNQTHLKYFRSGVRVAYNNSNYTLDCVLYIDT